MGKAMSNPEGKAIATARCEGITSAGRQCKCYATQKVNDIPYCEQHVNKAIAEALAMEGAKEEGRARD